MTQAPPSEFGLKPLSILALILALAAALRFHNIGKDGMWLDEMLTVEETTAHGFGQMDFPQGQLIERPPDYTTMANSAPWYYIFPRSHYDTHPPLIHLLLRIWRQIVPDTDVWMRALMVLFSLAAIVMLYIAVATQAGAVPALWACLLMALAAVQVEYGQEARSYSLLVLCLLGCCAAVLRIEKLGFTRPRGAALGISAFAAAMTHYLSFPQLGVIFLYILIRLRGRDRTRSLTALFLAGFLFCVIWGPFALGQRHGRATQHRKQPGGRNDDGTSISSTPFRRSTGDLEASLCDRDAHITIGQDRAICQTRGWPAGSS